MIPCKDCRDKKKKVFFDIEKAREAAKQLAIEKQETYCIYQQGGKFFYSSAIAAAEQGFTIKELLSKHL